MNTLKQRGFTLVELLVVIAIIALLAAIIFPVFASVRGKARQIACLSNMRQIGVAITMYTQDHDEIFPYAVDPSDKYTQPNIWKTLGLDKQIAAIPLLNPWPGAPANDPQPGVLTPYIKSNDLWRCPADTGFDELDNYPVANNLPARPTFFQKYGTSYLERTEIAYSGTVQGPRNYSALVAYDAHTGCTQHSVAEINVLQDGNGSWHGGYLYAQKRYNLLMADGHAVNFDRARFDAVWALKLDPPLGCQ